MKRRAILLSLVVAAAVLAVPQPAKASHFQSYTATVWMSDGTACDLQATLSHSGGAVHGTTGIDCDGFVYRLMADGNLVEKAGPVASRFAAAKCLEFNAAWCSHSVTISPAVTGLSYTLSSIAFRIEAYLPATFTSYPAGCSQGTVPSSGRYRLICTAADLGFLLV